MDALSSARAAAPALRQRAGYPPGTLVPGMALAEAAARALGLPIAPLPASDPLLAGARALLDRTLGLIAVSRDLPLPAQAFSIAHELGHAALHAADALCHDLPDDASPDFDAAALETYSPLQRREVEASAFAAELLAPAAAVQAAFLGTDDGGAMTPSQIAAALGVSEGLALAQLHAAFFGDTPLPPLGESAGERGASAPLPPQGESGDWRAQFLKSLDPGQRTAATVAAGPVVVDAGPGAGKTHTVLGRIAFLLQRGAITADQVLVLTFSVAAANELRQRLRTILPEAEGVTVSTVHGWALDLLRRYSDAAGLPFNLRVLDGFGARRLVASLLPSLPLREHRNLHAPEEPLSALLQAIARAQDEAWSPDDFALHAEQLRGAPGVPAGWAQRADEAAATYRAYLDALAAHGAVDFGEMVRRALLLLRERPDVRAAVQTQYRAVLVDEYQDTNRATALLLRQLAGDGRGLWVVGDAWQAVYRFRGAAPGNFRAFAADFPGAQRLPLGRNYRSRPLLVATLQAAAAALMPDESEAQWEAARRTAGGPSVWLATAPDAAAELHGLAEAVARRRVAGTPLRDQAVLCRTHAQAEEAAAALHTRGVPALAARPFTDAISVRGVLGALAVLAGDATGLVTLAEWQGIEATPDEIRAAAAGLAGDMGQWPAHPAPLSPAAAGERSCGRRKGIGVTPLATAAAALRAAHAGHLDASRTLLRLVFADDGPARRTASLPPEDAVRETAALRHLLTLAGAARRDPLAPVATATPAALLGWLRARIAAGDARASVPEDTAIDAVPVLTVHAAKGREFPVVYVPQLAAGRFPPRARPLSTPLPPDLMPSRDAVDLEEEASLLFVAMSRARDALVLSHAEVYDGVKAQPSPLLRRLQGVFAALPPARLRWDVAPPLAPPATKEMFLPDTIISTTVYNLAWYQRCPRQFAYGAMMGLTQADAAIRTDGSLLARGVAATLAWLQAESEAGTVRQPDDAAACFGTWWQQHDGDGHPFAADVVATGEAAARNAALLERTPGAPVDFLAEVAGIRITAAGDAAVALEDGSLRLTLALTGGAGEAERASDRAAVLRVGTRQAGLMVEVETVALVTGERRPLAASAAEDAARLDALATTARAMASEAYPARPDRRERCASCPFVLVCRG